MRMELYQWMKNLAFFHVLGTAILHILPDKRYEQYIRLFLGLLLVLLIISPVFAFFGKSSELLDGFQKYYGEEEQERMKNEAEGIQEAFLKEAYKNELVKQVRDVLNDAGITDAEVSSEETAPEKTKTVLIKIKLQRDLTKEQKEAVKDGLKRSCGLEEDQYQIEDPVNGLEGVGNRPAAGNPSSGGGTSGIKKEQ
ncbi:stage III sporulation protein AF [Blautia sp. CLA-JM-H16]|uniref:Stage III sporulation protein AF n=1 Tax=Blautia aquisgranensis TaxID=3133153 RepID=A0ABV1BD15_9FIRM